MIHQLLEKAEAGGTKDLSGWLRDYRSAKSELEQENKYLADIKDQLLPLKDDVPSQPENSSAPLKKLMRPAPSPATGLAWRDPAIKPAMARPTVKTAEAKPALRSEMPLRLLIQRNTNATEAEHRILELTGEINLVLDEVRRYAKENQGSIGELRIQRLSRGTPTFFADQDALREWLGDFSKQVNSGNAYRENSNLIRALKGLLDNLSFARDKLQLPPSAPKQPVPVEPRPPIAIVPMPADETTIAYAKFTPEFLTRLGTTNEKAEDKLLEFFLLLVRKKLISDKVGDLLLDATIQLNKWNIAGREGLFLRLIESAEKIAAASNDEVKREAQKEQMGAIHEMVRLGEIAENRHDQGQLEIGREFGPVTFFPPNIIIGKDGKYIINGSVNSTSQKIDADGYFKEKSAPGEPRRQTLIEAKYCAHSGWLTTGEIKTEEDRKVVFKMISQTRKYKAALENREIKISAVELHITAPMLHEQALKDLVAAFKKQARKVKIYQYTSLETKEGRLVFDGSKMAEDKPADASAKQPGAGAGRRWGKNDSEAWVWAASLAKGNVGRNPDPNAIHSNLRHVHISDLFQKLRAIFERGVIERRLPPSDEHILELEAAHDQWASGSDKNRLSNNIIKRLVPVIIKAKSLI